MSDKNSFLLMDAADNCDNLRVPLSAAERKVLKPKYPYYGAQGIIDYVDNYLFDGEYLLVAEDGENLKSRKENLCTLVNGKFWVNNHAHILKARSNFNIKYLYYYLNAIDFSGLVTGSAQPKLTKESLDSIPLVVPDRPTQDRVADFLWSLDRKIKLNDQINSEIESIAKLIYNYWFVQFDFPDESGKPYKSSGGKMVYNEDLKKEVPNTWSVRNISEKMQIGSGYPFKSVSYLNSGTYKIVTIKNVQDNKLELDNTDFVNSIPSDIDSSCILTLQDILISLTGNVGRICLVDKQNLLLNQRVGKFQTDPMLKNYFYLTYRRPEFRSWLEIISTGTSQKNLSPIDAVNRLHPFPDSSTLTEFEELVDPMIKRMLLNLEENRRLETLRNWLLPMLMNGQIIINEAS